MVIYEGPSLLDGKPVVVIATGFNGSNNAKTGDMIQTWILRSDIDPLQALREGEDFSICGDCKHRGLGNGKQRSCYVAVFQAPLNIYRTYKAGKYPKIESHFALRDLGRNRQIRIGSYGDPAAIPVTIWGALAADADGCSGYTHQWRNVDNLELSRYAMASVDSEQELMEAWKIGWRTFRVRQANEPIKKGEFTCPASKEAGSKLQCSECLSCNGSRGLDDRRASVTIKVHGKSGIDAAFSKNSGGSK